MADALRAHGASKPSAPAEPEIVARLRALAEKATKGDWWTGPHYRNDVLSRYGTVATVGQFNSQQGIDDANYIAALDPQTILSLLDQLASLALQVERLTEERGALQRDLDDADEQRTRQKALLTRDLNVAHAERERLAAGVRELEYQMAALSRVAFHGKLVPPDGPYILVDDFMAAQHAVPPQEQ